MLQVRFIWRFFFGGKYVGFKGSFWSLNPHVRFITTAPCVKPNLILCLKAYKRHKLDNTNYRENWHLTPRTICNFIL